jgi:hypothetical protein
MLKYLSDVRLIFTALSLDILAISDLQYSYFLSVYSTSMMVQLDTEPP